ncbi:hypothetical protein HELRODRAFT_181075 [Helobdella robusta]|uniref:Uncharacterized protein n=1 Tax=Helobdella robusta TaxID=6412 RepID=T1FGL1_HELRO|nr:hypothetical protein HELRODRAFT_181075 [Helobdella robusta]ESN93329.1 hypothetical protein HELRODRAFT_181075 [Helobdella robusta]
MVVVVIIMIIFIIVFIITIASFMMMHLNEYSMAQSVYTFHGDSKNWVDHLRKAKKDYQTIRSDYSLRNSACTDISATDQPSKPILIPDKRFSSNDSPQDRATQESSQTHHPKRKPSSSTDLLADDHSICKSSASFPLASQISQLSVPISSTSISRSNSEHHKVNPDAVSSSQAHVTSVDRRGTSSDRLRRKFKLRQLSGGSLNESSDEYDLVAANVEVRPTPPKTTILELCSSTPYLPVDVKSMENTYVGDSNVSISTLVTPSIQVRRPSCQHRKSISEPLKHFLTEAKSLSASGSSEYMDSPDGEYKQWLDNNVVADKNSIKCLSSSMHDLNSIPPTIINSNLSGSTSRLYDKIKTDSVDTISLDDRSIDPSGDSNLSNTPRGTQLQLNNSTEKQQPTANTNNATCNVKDDEGIAIEIDNTNLEDDPIDAGDGPATSKKESTSSVEEFHLCCLPEDYFCIPSSNSSVIGSNSDQQPLSPTWKKHRHHQLLSVTEVSTQTPIEFLISGYFSIVTPIDIDYNQRSTTHSRSLPDIFDVLAVNYLKNGNTDLYKCPTNALLNSRVLQAK